MPRFALCLFLTCFFLSSLILFTLNAKAQSEPPHDIKTTPGLLRQVAATRQAIDALPADERLPSLFQLLALQMQYEPQQDGNEKEGDKTLGKAGSAIASARETIAAILATVRVVDKELTRQQALEVVVYALADLGDCDEALKTAATISKPASRAEVKLAIAEKMLESKGPKAAALSVLHQALADAEEAKNAALEATCHGMLGKELARDGDKEEAVIHFQQARTKAREIEAVEERNVAAAIVRGEIEAGLIPEALDMIATITDAEMKQGVQGFAAVVLLKEGKKEESDKLFAFLKPGNVRNNVLMTMVRETADTITLEKILELASQVTEIAAEQQGKDAFLLAAAEAMSAINRMEVAAELIENIQDGTEAKRTATMELQSTRLAALLDEKKWDEAQKLVDSFDDPQTSQAATRYILLNRLQADGGDDAAEPNATGEIGKLADATFSEHEKALITEMREEMTKTAQLGSPAEQMAALSEILQTQFGLFDLFGAKNTLNQMLLAVEKLDDPASVIAYRMELSPIQLQLGDRAGVRKNSVALRQCMEGVTDLMTLEKLVSEAEAEHNPEAPIAVVKPITEADIKDRLFEIYFAMTGMLMESGDHSEAQTAFGKAQQLAETENDPMKKTEKMLLLTRLAADMP